MDFESGHLYHIYNQGNNKKLIFFNENNYKFFFEKLRIYILPYADILAYCLMPNHFHLMVYIREVELEIKSQGFTSSEKSQGFTWSETLTKTQSGNQSEALTKTRSFNDSIGIMLRSYTRAINKQEKEAAHYSEKETKAKPLNSNLEYRKPYYTDNGITKINITSPEFQYPQQCFNYIHQNPVNAGLCNSISEYQYSSAKDYLNKSNNSVINFSRASEYLIL